MNLAQRSVLVLGLGESGLAMARWCLREGACVRVADTRESPPNRDALEGVELILGAFTEALLDGVELIAISPGLSPQAEPQATMLIEAKAAGIPICGEIELFAQKLATLKDESGYAPRVVAITGTNGKTTVTRLVGKMCESAGRSVAVAGNVSPAALAALTDALDGGQPLPDIWVLELSSFQLDTTTSLVADGAIVLNITQDHLDWHGSMEAYVKAKAAIFAPSTVRVLNRDDARVLAMDALDVPSVRFGLDVPERPGDFGIVRDRSDADSLRWLAVAEGDAPDAEARGIVPGKTIGKRRVSRAAALAANGPVRVKRLMPADALRIRGDHNVANVLAALALGRAIGLPMAAMLHTARAYRGEPHRVAFVLEHDNVDWIEDSKGTNVGATAAALQGLGRKVVLIAGGVGKGQDFSPLAAPVGRHARAVMLIGRDRAVIADALRDTGVPLFECETLEQAVDEAALVAEPGDAVLLSPACASFDMFRDYEERAAVFVAAVRRLAATEHATC
ncbi:MAG: UDP-N-acetylmuramoyl-L-alanine--D-glutamate ligase [Burkholderiaceae bacterium]